MINDKQAKILMIEYQHTGSITMSSLKAVIDRDTGSKYIKNGKMPSESKPDHNWKTRKDAFEFVKGEIKEYIRLDIDMDIEAQTILDFLQDKYPGQFKSNLLRTLQRRVKVFKLQKKKDRDIMFSQEHHPGKRMMLDWTFCNELKITINGSEFKHKLCHAVLPFSKWESASICQSESLLSLKKGFQDAVFSLGKVPIILQTDNSSSATHRVNNDAKKRSFNTEYKSFLSHFNVEPQTTNVRCPNENGTVESLNGHLKKRLKQALILRGNREFSSIDKYDCFLQSVVAKANKPRQEALKEELSLMEDVPPIRLPEYQEESHKVTTDSLVRLKKVSYSVPSYLIKEELRFRIYEDRIKVYHKSKNLFDMDRVHGDRGASINYRHVIHSLRRKVGAFAEWKYREQMFPTPTFRRLYDRLEAFYDNRVADREYLDILHLAATESEKKVEAHVQDMLASNVSRLGLDFLKQLMNTTISCPETNEIAPSLSEYDDHISGGVK